MKHPHRQDYIKILMEERFDTEDIKTTGSDLELLNSLPTEQLKLMLKQDNHSYELDSNDDVFN